MICMMPYQLEILPHQKVESSSWKSVKPLLATKSILLEWWQLVSMQVCIHTKLLPAEMSVLFLCRRVHRYQETATGEREGG